MEMELPEGPDYSDRRNTQNLQERLWDRESGRHREVLRGRTPLLAFEREFYRSIPPNLSILNVNKPMGFLRKFTPDGQLLLGFSIDQRSIEIYRYMGVGQVASLLHNITSERIAATDRSFESLRVRQEVFERLFQLRWRVKLLNDETNRWQLNREFSIFLADSQYVLLSAMGKDRDCYPPEEYFLLYPDLQDEHEMYEYKFILVDLQRGCLSDVYNVRKDYITLSHNHGVSAYGSTIALLSQFRQCIELLELRGGKLVPMLTINSVELWQTPGNCILSRLKQRVLAYLYLEIMKEESVESRSEKLKAFYQNFKIYEYMIMCKMQLIDAEHLLIRYECPSRLPPNVIKETDKLEFKLYVFYCIADERILKIFPKNSTELLDLLRNCYDSFRNVYSSQTGRAASSPSNNCHLREIFDRMVDEIPGGLAQAAQRFNVTLPIGTQSCTTSPYLDYSLFDYDERCVSALERPKPISARSIPFTCRRTNEVKFRLYLEQTNRYNAAAHFLFTNSRELVAFIFHPYEPFIITIQRLPSRYMINFHIYNESTIVSNIPIPNTPDSEDDDDDAENDADVQRWLATYYPDQGTFIMSI